MNLQGKVVLITGGRRVGSEIAKKLAGRGCQVAMTYHTSRPTIEKTLLEVEALGARTLAIQADLADADQAARAVAETVRGLGRLDFLVNMASIYKKTPFVALEPGDFHAMIAANLAAPYFTAVAAAKQMRLQSPENGLKGKIVNVGDWATDRPYKDYLPYLAAKGGLTTMTLALAKELAPEITVNIVQPAMIDPPPDFSTEDREAVLQLTPLKRIGCPDDLNELILFLLEKADFATGSCYRVDGGRFLGQDD